ncbi:MAG: CDP-alcohol phosphatidyltransferase family protein [Acidobacteriota bacterium]|nr:CDP-alcohol phosphatidyltransferase family protein [Blastocatellia bacterium]MDW8413555.1 CDP-alcohol phosphatidyltransferase family protein [Acidobacteriota bacterium]
MLGEQIGNLGKRALNAIVEAIAALNPNPNHLTLVGLLINIAAAFLFGYGHFFIGGLVLLFANIFDMLDGRVARLTGRVTKFGAFFDSVMDRYSDIIVLVGITIYYARDTKDHSTLYVALTGIAIVGSVLVSYTRARAESLISGCKVGFLERPERVVLLVIGSLTEIGPYHLFLHKMKAVIWVLAVLSHWTVIHRVYHTWKEVQLEDATARQAIKSTTQSPTELDNKVEIFGA